jgi:hypothetical protein
LTAIPCHARTAGVAIGRFAAVIGKTFELLIDV